MAVYFLASVAINPFFHPVGKGWFSYYFINKWYLSASFIACITISAYKKFVAEGKNQPSPWAELRNQIYLGGESFVEKMHSLIDGNKELSEIPSS